MLRKNKKDLCLHQDRENSKRNVEGSNKTGNQTVVDY